MGSLVPCYPVIGHDSPSTRELFETPAGKRFGNVEDPKEHKAAEQILPVEHAHSGVQREHLRVLDIEERRGSPNRRQAENEREMHSGYFVNHYVLRVLYTFYFSDLRASTHAQPTHEQPNR